MTTGRAELSDLMRYAGRLAANCPITLVLAGMMTVLNLGLMDGTPVGMKQVTGWLEYDTARIEAGEFWRLLTGNLVHWSVEHACLDIGAFAVVGAMFEHRLRRGYASMLFISSLGVGLALWIAEPLLACYRGFSGVNSAQFAAVVVVELAAARRTPRRMVWVAPAAGIFVVKILSECATGAMFFGTESLGDIGLPVPLAHATGALTGALLAGGWCAVHWPATDAPRVARALHVCQNCESRGAR